jgi:general secretion pathway protein M
MDNLRIWWQGLAQREQQLVSVAGFFLVIGVFYWGIWSPISEAQKNAEADHNAALKTLNFVKQSANKLVGLQQAGATATASGSLSALVNQGASQFG